MNTTNSRAQTQQRQRSAKEVFPEALDDPTTVEEVHVVPHASSTPPRAADETEPYAFLDAYAMSHQFPDSFPPKMRGTISRFHNPYSFTAPPEYILRVTDSNIKVTLIPYEELYDEVHAQTPEGRNSRTTSPPDEQLPLDTMCVHVANISRATHLSESVVSEVIRIISGIRPQRVFLNLPEGTAVVQVAMHEAEIVISALHRRVWFGPTMAMLGRSDASQVLLEEMVAHLHVKYVHLSALYSTKLASATLHPVDSHPKPVGE